MRFLLALLTCFLFLNAQTYAISAGPVFDGDSGLGTTGTYSGLLIPANSDTDSSTSNSSSAANSIGLFNLSVPDTGLGTGTFIMFSEGRVFSGTIDGFGDPSSGEISGILQATYNYTLTRLVPTQNTVNGTTTTTFSQVTTDVTAGVHGNFKANTESDTGATSATGVRISGTAVLDIDQGKVNNDGSPVITETLDFELEGIQQSTTATTTAG